MPGCSLLGPNMLHPPLCMPTFVNSLLHRFLFLSVVHRSVTSSVGHRVAVLRLSSSSAVLQTRFPSTNSFYICKKTIPVKHQPQIIFAFSVSQSKYDIYPSFVLGFWFDTWWWIHPDRFCTVPNFQAWILDIKNFPLLQIDGKIRFQAVFVRTHGITYFKKIPHSLLGQFRAQGSPHRANERTTSHRDASKRI